jgi:hypothetical protein
MKDALAITDLGCPIPHTADHHQKNYDDEADP